MSDKEKTDRDFDRYMKLGWAPVVFKHQPSHIKKALRSAKVRPKIKGCFETNTKLVLFQEDVPLTYCEGWVSTDRVPFPFQHAWVRDETGADIDVTITPVQPTILVGWEVPVGEMRRTVISRGFYGPIRGYSFQETQQEAYKLLGFSPFNK